MCDMAREWCYRGLVIARREADDGVQGRRLPTQPRHAFHVLANVSPDLLASNLAGRFHSDAGQKLFGQERKNEWRQKLLKQRTDRHYDHKDIEVKDV